MRYVTIKQDICVEDYSHIDYKTDNDTSIKISANIFFNAYASIYLTIHKGLAASFEIGCHCISMQDIFSTLKKVEDMARNYSEEAKEILSDLLPKEGSEAKEILSDLIPPES